MAPIQAKAIRGCTFPVAYQSLLSTDDGESALSCFRWLCNLVRLSSNSCCLRSSAITCCRSAGTGGPEATAQPAFSVTSDQGTDVQFEVGGYEVIKQYVRLNLGISIVMSHCLTKQDQLHRKSVKRYFPHRHYGVVLRKGRQLTRPAARFVQTLYPEWQEKTGSGNP